MVFDGFELHAKRDTKKKREAKRARYILKRDLAKKEGRLDDYIKFKNYSMTIEKKHILLLMDYLRFAKVEFVVSPFEADAQLAYMHKIGQIDYVVTEDSDLVLYDCENLVNKLNQSGYCELLQIKNDNLMYNNSDTEEVEDFVRLTQEQKIWMALMVGCDYLQKVRGVGLKKGILLIQNVTSLQMLFARLREKCKRFDDSPEYKTAFKNCELVFKYQRVYNYKTKELCFFQQPDEPMLKHMRTVKDLEHYVGHKIPNLREHIKGVNIEKQVAPRDRLSYDFKSLEYKISNKKEHFQMNYFSNLVMHDPSKAPISKDDFEVFLKSNEDFYDEEKNEESLVMADPKSKDSFREETSRPRARASRFRKSFARRSRSSDLPAEDSEGVSIENLKRSVEKSKKRRGATESTSRKKVKELKSEKMETPDLLMEEILEAAFPTPDKRPSKISDSTKINSRVQSQLKARKQKPKVKRDLKKKPRRNFEKSTRSFAKISKRLRMAKEENQIIEMEDLLDSGNFWGEPVEHSANISYHMPRLRNEETEQLPHPSKIIYSNDQFIRKQRQRSSRISKFSQNMRGEPLVEDLENIEFGASDEEPRSKVLTKRRQAKRISQSRGRKPRLAKRVKVE